MSKSQTLRIIKSTIYFVFSLTRTFGGGQACEPLLGTWSRKPFILVSASKIDHPSFFVGSIHASPGFYSNGMSSGMTIEHIVKVIVHQCRRRRLVARSRRCVTDGERAVGAKPRSTLLRRAYKLLFAGSACKAESRGRQRPGRMTGKHHDR